MKRPKQLYGHPVCRRCRDAFLHRRHLAWIVDMFLVTIAQALLGMAFFSLVGRPSSQADQAMENLFLYAMNAGVFLVKDGFAGYSPGKGLLGVRVVDDRTGAPTGFLRSAARNLLLLIPIAPLVVAFSMGRGHRIGDAMAKTRVI